MRQLDTSNTQEEKTTNLHNSGSTQIKIPDGEIHLFRQIFSLQVSQRYLGKLLKTVDWQQHKIRIFGRQILCPRLSAWYGDQNASYSYSGLQLEPTPWCAELLEIKGQIEAYAGCSFNSVLLNLYRHGSDSMGWHSDDEPELGDRPVIASLSFGSSRRFVMRHRTCKEAQPLNLSLGHGDLLIMAGETQNNWRHQVPKTKKEIGPRVNLTFRRIVGA